MDFISTHWAGIIALLALITSLISNIISFYTFKLQRTHIIKSVKPIIQIGQWDYENNLSVDLRNSGLGLAIIKEVIVVNKRDEVKNCIYDWLPKKLPDKMNYKEYWTAYKNFVVQPGQIFKLIDIPINLSIPKEIIEREKLRSILRQLTIKITYEDLYENQMPLKEIELYHFSRTDNEN